MTPSSSRTGVSGLAGAVQQAPGEELVQHVYTAV
jgi:hypothetical protein